MDAPGHPGPTESPEFNWEEVYGSLPEKNEILRRNKDFLYQYKHDVYREDEEKYDSFKGTRVIREDLSDDEAGEYMEMMQNRVNFGEDHGEKEKFMRRADAGYIGPEKTVGE